MAVREWKQISETEVVGVERFGKALTHKKVLDPDRVEHDFYGYQLKPSVVVMAVTNDGMVVTAMEFKQGSMQTQQNFPAGYSKRVDGVLESLEQTALSRLRDKSGYIGGEMIFLGQKFVIPRHSDGQVHFYLCLGCTPSEGQKLDQSDGDIDVVLVPLDEWILHVETGQTSEMFTMTCTTLAKSHLRKRGLIA